MRTLTSTTPYEEFNRAILMRGGQYTAPLIMRDGAVSQHTSVGVDRRAVHDPVRPSVEVGSGALVDSPGWTK